MAEIKTTPLASLGGLSAFLAFLALIAEKSLSHRGKKTSSVSLSSNNTLEPLTKMVLWSASSISVAILLMQLSFILGFLSGLAAYAIGLWVLDHNCRVFRQRQNYVACVASSAIVSAIIFGVFWEAVLAAAAASTAAAESAGEIGSGFVMFPLILLGFASFIGVMLNFFTARDGFNNAF